MIIRFEYFSASPAIRLPRPGLLIRSIKPQIKPQTVQPDGWIANLIADCDFYLSGPVQILEGGLRHETWILPTTAGKKVLKRYKSTQDLNQIQYEHAIFQHLEQKRFPTPRLVPNNQGLTILETDRRLYALFDYLDGYYQFSNYLFFPSQQSWFLTEMGRSLSALHEALKDFIPLKMSTFGFLSKDQNRIRDLNWHLSTLDQNRWGSEKLIHVNGDPIHRLLLSQAASIEERLIQIETQITAASLERCTIHGDFGPHNLMVKPGAPVCVLDFELARLDWQLIDLVSACSTTIAGQPPDSYLPKIIQILAGYQSMVPLPRDELALLPTVWQFMLLRKIIACWDQYLASGDRKWANEIYKRLSRLKWVDVHANLIA